MSAFMVLFCEIMVIKMIKLIFAIAFFSINFSVQAASIGNIFGALMGRSSSPELETTVDEALVSVSSQINKNMPVLVDKETRLDRVSAEPGQQFIYHYTLLSISKKDISSDEFYKLIKPQLKSRLCGSTEMQKFLKSGVTVSYLYRGSDGHALGGVTFVPSDCGYKS